MNGNASGRVGVAKDLAVSPGDQISISAYARYLSPSGTPNPNAFITALASAFGVSSGSTGEALKIYNGLNSWAALVPNGSHTGDNGSYPKAFVTILLFDKNYVLQDAAWDQVSTTAATNHDLVTISYAVKQPGYAYFFVSNEHFNAVDIYFDDVTVSHTQSPIVAGSDYYPYGLVMDGTDITDEKYRYGYQGQFSEKDATTGYNEFELRMYDARFGRWLSVDPYGQFVSPYVGMGNNPTMSTDPDGGLCCGDLIAQVVANTAKSVAESGIYLGEIVVRASESMGASTLGSAVIRGGYALEFGYNFKNGILSKIPISKIPTSSSPIILKGPEMPYRVSFDAESILPQYTNVEAQTNQFIRNIHKAQEPWGDAAMTLVTGVGGAEYLAGKAILGIGTGLKFAAQGHHLIPKAIFSRFNLGKYGFNINGAFNVKKYPVPFHSGRHDAYSNYVAERIRNIDNLDIHKLNKLMHELRQEVNQVYLNHFKTGKVKNLNSYYKNLGY